MKFPVQLNAFKHGQVRVVEVPDIECMGNTNSILENIYRYGQNEVQPVKDRCSISPGDVIELRGRLYLILSCGFRRVSKQLNEFLKLNPRQKMKYLMGKERRKMAKPNPQQPETAFTMGEKDRFHAIIASNPIRYEQDPKAETVMVFFCVRRASGKLDIFHVMKTFKGAQCVSRNIQSKLNIAPDNIAAELNAIKNGFTKGIKDATGYVISWNELDLSQVKTMDKQVRRIQAWDRVNVIKMPEIGLN